MKIFSIRNGRLDDLPRLTEIESDAAQSFREVRYVFRAELPKRPEESFRRAIETGALFVAETTDHRPIGFALMWRVDASAHLLDTAVVRAHQGRGVGRRLIGQCEAWARACGFHEITLTAFRDVPWNGPLYERLGYRPFQPEEWRIGLREIIREEVEGGFAQRPRITMRKSL